MRGFQNLCIAILLLLSVSAFAQNERRPVTTTFDTTQKSSSTGVKLAADTIRKDTILKPVHSPRIATLRSAILPGLGQAYNRQYWKIPLVYAAIGIPAGFYFYNNSWYKKSKLAYEIRTDTTRVGEIDPQLEVLSTESLRFYRNEFRRNKDYSLLYMLLAWGLNVVDATVSGHLKEFDVSDDLSMRVNPVFNPGSNTKGVGVVVAFKKPKQRMLSVR